MQKLFLASLAWAAFDIYPQPRLLLAKSYLIGLLMQLLENKLLDFALYCRSDLLTKPVNPLVLMLTRLVKLMEDLAM